jgi:hypothetical protein
MMNLLTKDNASINLGYGKANVGASWEDNNPMRRSLYQTFKAQERK